MKHSTLVAELGWRVAEALRAEEKTSPRKFSITLRLRMGLPISRA